MSMHSDHHSHDFAHNFDGSMWPGIYVLVGVLALATFAWAMS